MTSRPAVLVVLLALALAASCEGAGACEEDIRAQLLDERVEVELDGAVVLAELADEAVERDRGWKHRRCDREALLLIPDAPPAELPVELPVWGCGLVEAVEAVFIAERVVVAVHTIAPCPEPCGGCPQIGEGLLVDAVLELPAGAGVEVGDAVDFAP